MNKMYHKVIITSKPYKEFNISHYFKSLLKTMQTEKVYFTNLMNVF